MLINDEKLQMKLQYIYVFSAFTGPALSLTSLNTELTLHLSEYPPWISFCDYPILCTQTSYHNDQLIC